MPSKYVQQIFHAKTCGLKNIISIRFGQFLLHFGVGTARVVCDCATGPQSTLYSKGTTKGHNYLRLSPQWIFMSVFRITQDYIHLFVFFVLKFKLRLFEVKEITNAIPVFVKNLTMLITQLFYLSRCA